MYQYNTSSWIKHFDFILLDLIGLEAAFAAACLIQAKFSMGSDPDLLRETNLLLILMDICAVFFLESYKGILRRNRWSELAAVVKHVSTICVAVLICLFITKKAGDSSRMIFVGMWGLAIGFMYIVRVCRKRYIYSRVKHRHGSRALLVVASMDNAEEVIRTIRENPFDDLRMVGIVILEKNQVGRVIEGVPVVSDIAGMLEYIRLNWVDEVFINLPEAKTVPQEVIDGCNIMGLTVHRKIAPATSPRQRQIVEQIAGCTVVSSCFGMATGSQLFLKRLLDIVGGLAGLFMTAVIFVLIAPVIYLKSPGPIFFSQVRVGKNGKKFKIYKFRSMYMDAEERKKDLMDQNEIKDGMMFKVENDPRIIQGIGHFIRNTSIDEFPQFWNILKGDMSLVGTRPPTLDEWEKYQLHHRARLAIKPGLTGIWQVSGRSDIRDFEEVVRMDTEYIKNWSLWLDIKILVKTVSVVLKRKGAK